MIREQLDQATAANQQLSLEIQKLTSDWNKAREEIDNRDDEEQAYFTNEHARLMELWKTLNGFRRQFNEMKSATQRLVQVYMSYVNLFHQTIYIDFCTKLNISCYTIRDLSMVRADVNKSVRVVQGACMDLDKNLRGMDATTQAALEEERSRRQKVEILIQILRR